MDQREGIDAGNVFAIFYWSCIITASQAAIAAYMMGVEVE